MSRDLHKIIMKTQIVMNTMNEENAEEYQK